MEQLPPIWIMNLPRSPERRNKMAEHMAAFGLPYEFVPGVDGLSLTESDLSRYSRPRALRMMERELALNEIGCALAHIRLYERIVRDRIEEVLILEDDVRLTTEFLELLKRRRHFGVCWDTVNFASNHQSRHVPAGAPLPGSYGLFQIKGTAIRTACYLITQQGAQTALTNIFPIRAPADDALYRSDICRLAAFCILPSPVMMTDDPTTIWIAGQGDHLEHVTPNLRYKAQNFIHRTIEGLLSAVSSGVRRCP